MVPGRGLGAVVDMKVDQPILMGKEEGHVPLPRGLGVADIPGEAEDGAFQQIFDSSPLVGEKAVRVLDGDPKGAVADPPLAQGAEADEGGQIGVKIPIVHLHLLIRQGDVDAVVQVHIHRQGLGAVPEPIPEGQQPLGHGHGPPHGLEICLRHQGVEVGHIQVFIEMDGIIDPRPLGKPQQLVRLLQPRHLVLREVHVELDEAEAQPGAKGRIVLQRSVLDQRRHPKFHGLPPLCRVARPLHKYTLSPARFQESAYVAPPLPPFPPIRPLTNPPFADILPYAS